MTDLEQLKATFDSIGILYLEGISREEEGVVWTELYLVGEEDKKEWSVLSPLELYDNRRLQDDYQLIEFQDGELASY